MSIRNDLREMGHRLWPDDAALRPRPRLPRSRWPSGRGARTRTLIATSATAAVLIASLVTALIVGRSPSHALEGDVHGVGGGPTTILQMLDEQFGWGWGATVVTRTTDGVTTLYDVTPVGVDTNHHVTLLSALDADHAWLAVDGGSTLSIFRTTDGGARWVRSSLGEQGAAQSIDFVDSMHGWLEMERWTSDHRARDVSLLRTQDGGATWNTIYRSQQRITIQPNVQVGDCRWSGLAFTSPLTGFVGLSCDQGTSPQLDVTRDAGTSWHRVAMPALTSPAALPTLGTSVDTPTFDRDGAGSTFVTVCAGDNNSCTVRGALYLTTDGGVTWTPGTIVRAGYRAVASDATHAWIPYGCLEPCPPGPQMLRTDDGGRHWTAQTLQAGLGPNRHGGGQFIFVTPLAGFALYGQEFDPILHFYRTSDGGKTFVEFRPRLVSG